jgi:hypothetical protein
VKTYEGEREMALIPGAIGVVGNRFHWLDEYLREYHTALRRAKKDDNPVYLKDAATALSYYEKEYYKLPVEDRVRFNSPASLKSKALAKDSSTTDRRARLHRALDCVLDRKAAKDSAGDIVGTSRCKRCGRRVPVIEDHGVTLYDRHYDDDNLCPNSGKWAMQYTKTAKDFKSQGRKAAKDAEGDYEVVWTDREYKEHRKVFKNDPQGAPDNASVDAHKYAKKLELAHNHSTYGSLRTLSVKAL